MSRFKSERGGAGLGFVIALAVFLFVAYEAKQFGPPLIAQFEFQDAVVEAAKFSRGKPASAVQAEVFQKANEIGIPVQRELIQVRRQPTNTLIQVSYTLQAEWLPGRLYQWTVNVNEESMLF